MHLHRSTGWRRASMIAILLAGSCFSAAASNPSLAPRVLVPLPLGSISPAGWLQDQLQLMGDGLAGHEHDFYDYVADSSWLGGSSEYSDLNEGFPYWFNGLVPLAYGLNDQRLKSQVSQSVNYVLSHQQSDGWLGPETDNSTRNIWGRFPFFLGLAQLAEAENGTDASTQILNSMHKFITLMHAMLEDNYLGYVAQPGQNLDDQWGRARAADMILGLQWLYEHDPRSNTQIIFDCMDLLYEKASNWSNWYTDGLYIKQDLDTVPINITEYYYPFEHGVNVGQGLKFGAVIQRLTRQDSFGDNARTAVNWTFQYHGQPSGVVIGDERMSGLSPVRGVELCSVVETIYSLTYLYQTLGDVEFADRAELAAYNALPVMLTPNWWAHQYVSQTNQPISHTFDSDPFYNVDTEGQHFGLAPNYPCCTVNHPQGYPKFVSNSFVRSGDNGIAHALLGPTSVNTTTNSGVTVTVSVDTLYPFSYELVYTVQSSDDFDFYVRVPSWASSSSTISINGASASQVHADSSSGLHHIAVSKGETSIRYTLATGIRVTDRANDTVAIYHGSLLYSLPIGENVTTYSSNYTGAPTGVEEYDFYPTTTWALAIDPSTLTYNEASSSAILPNPVWSLNGPPVTITATVCEINWNLTGGYAPNPPLKADRKCIGDSFQTKLVPYGSARLHVAEIPTLSLT
ncbi:Genome polyprotein [Talaromyces islandicus]|uniref:Genome polyprotein n=1 Tax=Talaromyces islandicus TaxID=28573 RepID=A0A0U1LM54_TALIS|nr:Genome polyprotein [Talaromyces islandicus]